MAEDLRRRALSGDESALDELLRSEVAEKLIKERQKASQRESLLKHRIAFQEKVLALRDRDNIKYKACIDKMSRRLRVQGAELQALRSDIISKAFRHRCTSSCAREIGKTLRL